jgi:hypothetical protein
MAFDLFVKFEDKLLHLSFTKFQTPLQLSHVSRGVIAQAIIFQEGF